MEYPWSRGMSQRGSKGDEVRYQCVVPFGHGMFDCRIEELNKACGDAYKAHYECLDNHNQQFKDCRPAERGLNACVLAKMVCHISFQM